MKKDPYFKFKGFFITGILAFLFCSSLNSQTDVLDLCSSIYPPGCGPLGFSIITEDPNITAVFDFIDGRRSLTGSGDKVFNFAGKNSTNCTGTPTPTTGELHITFTSGGGNIGISKLSFKITRVLSLNQTVKLYSGGSEKPYNTSINGEVYTYEYDNSSNPCDLIVITAPASDLYTTTTYFVLDSFFIYSCTLPSAADPIVGSSEVCQGQTNVGFTVNPISNATGYIWELPLGASITEGDNTNSIKVSFSATSGIIRVYGTNACGNGIVSPDHPVLVDPASVGGYVSGGTEICAGSSPGPLTLSGHTGSIIKWQFSTNGITWNDISSTSNPYSPGSLTVTTQFRAVVKSGVCSEAFSGAETVPVDPQSVGGSVDGGYEICAGSPVGILTLTGNAGAVIKWQSSTNGTDWSDINNTTNTYSPGSLTVTTQFRAAVKSGVCPEAFSSAEPVPVDPQSVGGSVNGGSEICTGSTAGTLTLTGNIGVVIKWQSSTNGTDWSDINNATNTYSPGSLTVTTQFRAVVKSGVCPEVFSSAKPVLVDPQSIGGSVDGGSEICAGSTAGTLSLTGNIGAVIKWQSSTNGTNWSDINNTTNTYSPGSLTVTTQFRVAVKSGVCPEVFSSAKVVPVDPQSIGGSVDGGYEICAGSTAGALTLTGNTGAVTKWQSSTDGTNWSDINNTTNTYSPGSLTVTTQFRAVVKSGVCPEVPSSPEAVPVDPSSVGGIVTGGTIICSGSSSGPLTLSGQTGVIIKWQSSVNGTSWNDIPTTANPYTSGLLSTTTQFRAVVKSGVCPAVNSSPSTVIVNPAVTTLPQVVCLYDLSWSMNRDFYDAPTTTEEAKKIYHARNALKAFVDLLYTNHPCQSALGIARFPNSPQVGCDAGIVENFQTLNSTYDNNLSNSIITNLEADGNSTPLLAGVEKAMGMFNTSNPNKTIVLLTDGRQNCPLTNISGTITTDAQSLKNNGIKLFTIGFGDPTMVPDNILNSLVDATGGRHYNIVTSTDKISDIYNPDNPNDWHAQTALQAVYANIIKVLLGMGDSDDPLDIINPGEVKQFEIPVTVFDDRICFFVSWVTSQINYINVKLITPLGTELPLNQQGINVIRRNTHTIITLYENLLDKPGMTGTWHFIIDGSDIKNRQEHYQHSVLNSSKKLELKTWFEKQKYFAGDVIKIYSELMLDNNPFLTPERTIITGTRPEMSIGTWLTSRKVDVKMLQQAKQKQLEEYLKWLASQPQVENMNPEARRSYIEKLTKEFLASLDSVELLVHALKDEYNLSVPGVKPIKNLRFRDDGKNGDEKAKDGIYTAVYIPKFAGCYGFNISFSGISQGEKILRNNHIQTFVGTRNKLKPDFIIIRPSDRINPGENAFEVVFSLKDRLGNILMPEDVNNIGISIDKGNLIGELTDNMDGTFTQKMSLSESLKPNKVKMKLSYSDQTGIWKVARCNLTIIVIILPLAVAAFLIYIIYKLLKKKNAVDKTGKR